MFNKILAVFGLMALGITQINAQSINLGPQVGYQKAVDADNGRFMGGAALRIHLTPSLGAEASINYREEKYWNGGLKVKSWPIMITGLYYPIPIIYGAIGFGWYNTTFDYNQNQFPLELLSDETKQEVGWHFGGGLELPVGTNAMLTADVRYVFLNYDFKSVPGFSDTKSDFYVMTVGFLFGL